MSDATDVLQAIDQLRRDLSGYHGQLKAHNDLQRHCDNQRRRIAELEGLCAKAKAEKDEATTAYLKEYDRAEYLTRQKAKLRELVRCRDCMHFTPKGTHVFSDGTVNDDFCHYIRSWMLPISPDGFCAWGERKGR